MSVRVQAGVWSPSCFNMKKKNAQQETSQLPISCAFLSCLVLPNPCVQFSSSFHHLVSCSFKPNPASTLRDPTLILLGHRFFSEIWNGFQTGTVSSQRAEMVSRTVKILSKTSRFIVRNMGEDIHKIAHKRKKHASKRISHKQILTFF